MVFTPTPRLTGALASKDLSEKLTAQGFDAVALLAGRFPPQAVILRQGNCPKSLQDRDLLRQGSI